MVQSQTATVGSYIAEVGADRAPPMKKLRAMARRILRGQQERMQWGMPAYCQGDVARFAFASQKQYIALYLTTTGVRARNADALAAHDCGRSCLRFANPERIDWALVEKLLLDTRELARSES